MKPTSGWLRFTLLRLLLFAVPLAVLLILGVFWPISVIAAALIGFCLSYLLLNRPRARVSTALYAVRNAEHTAPTRDDNDEDAMLDAAEAASPAADAVAPKTEPGSERVGGAEHEAERER